MHQVLRLVNSRSRIRRVLRIFRTGSRNPDSVSRRRELRPPHSLDPAPFRFAGAGAVLLVGVTHGIHDLLDGDPLVRAFLPAVSIGMQFVTLERVHVEVKRRGWPSWCFFGLAIPISIMFGVFTVALHSRHNGVPASLLGYWVIVAGLCVLGGWILVSYYPRKLQVAKARVLAAEDERRRAELACLRANLHPHFLLNTLNAVAGLLLSDPQQARKLVSALGDLLRDASDDDREFRSLGQEVAWLQRYAEIFEIRHRGAISFHWDLSGETLATPIPCLLIQPLMENAIKHGALLRPGGGTVTLRSRMAGAVTCISVSDDGPGMVSERTPGVGLRLVRSRLELAYPKSKMLIDANGAGTTVILELPDMGVVQ